MRIKDLKSILNNFDNECPIEFEDKFGIRHKITNIRDDNCLVFRTLLLSERNPNSREQGQIIKEV